MSKPKPRHLDFIVDKLTNSIENVRTGEKFATRILRLHPDDSVLLSHLKWQFDWTIELHAPGREVYALTTVDNPDIYHGLICIEDMKDHIFMHLVESAPFNVGSNKEYDGGRVISLHSLASLRSKEVMKALSHSMQKQDLFHITKMHLMQNVLAAIGCL